MQKKSTKFRKIKIAFLFAAILFLTFGFLPKAVFATFPVISDISSNTPGTTSVTITWLTDISSNSLIEYGITSSYGNTKSDPNSTTNHSITLTGLSAGSPYHFRVKSSESGDQTVTGDQTFTTAVAPVISNVRMSEITNSSVTITWDTNVNSYGLIAYGNTSSYGQVVGNEEDYVTSHSITIAGFSAGVTKHYLPRAKDMDGNIWPYGADSTFTTGSPYVTSFSSTTDNGTYGPGGNINITASYADSASNNLAGSSAITVHLNNGASVNLDTVDAPNRTVSGTYTVDATGSGQDVTNLSVASITSQNVCDTNNYCITGLTMPATNVSSGINVDTTAPTFTIQYYSDSELSDSLGDNPLLKAGTYYIKITSNETLSATPTITINAQGSANDVTDAGTTLVSDNDYIYTRTINYDEAATGLSVEDLSVTGTDVANNTATNANPTNEATKAGYTDTIKPTVTGSITPTDYANARSVDINLTFDENMNQSVSPIIVIRKSDTGTISASGSFTSATAWSGTATISGSDANGTATLEVSSAHDLSGNVMDANTNVDQVLIDTANPTFTINEGTDAGPTKTDTINVSVSDASPSSNIVNQYYGFSSDDVCSSGDTIDNAFTSGSDFDITDNHTDYLCSRAIDGAGNIGYQLVGKLNTDNTAPTFTIQYYSDSELSDSLGDNPLLKAGTYYIKITSNETLSATPTITINAQGSANDVTDAGTTLVSDNDYIYTRTINYDEAATGLSVEDLSVTGTDVANNTATNANPTNEATKAAYTDTIKPTVTGSITPTDYANARSVDINLTFDENMNQSVSPIIVIRKSDTGTISASGSFTSATAWSGTATISGSDANGTATLEVSSAHDLSGNVMDANTNVDQVLIDTANPTFTINEGTDAGPTKTDTINVSVSDASPSSNIVNQYYGFSSDDVCSSGDTIDNAFTSGSDFDITDNHTDYLCSRAIDGAGNIGYQLVGKLNTDNTAPTFTIQYYSDSELSDSLGDNPLLKAGTYYIKITSNETLSATPTITINAQGSANDVTDAGTTLVSDNDYIYTRTINYDEAATGLSVEDLSVTGTDVANNTATNANPTNEATKAAYTDTVAPNINITNPLSENSVRGSSVITFTDDENRTPQCSIDNSHWIACSSGNTTMASFDEWGALPEGNFTLYLKDTDLAGNVGSDSKINVAKDTIAPNIYNITSSKENGYYKAGEIIPITVNFSENVTSTGLVTVTLETGDTDRSCSFSITNSNSGTCDYTVRAGDNSADLNITISSGVVGTIKDQAGNPLVDFDPTNGDLASNKNIIIDTVAPTISSVGINPDTPGTYKKDDQFTITVNFAEDIKSVNPNDYFQVSLNTGKSCSFKMDSFGNQGSCTYKISLGDYAQNLQVTNITADGTVQDRAGNSMANFADYTNFPSGIVVDTFAPGRPTITSITSTDGYYKAGQAITVVFNFSKNVTTNGNAVAVSFDSGGSCAFSISEGTYSQSESCVYNVLDGQNSSDLEATVSPSSIIKDQAGNDMIDFTPAAGLQDNYSVVVDTTAPSAPTSVSLTSPINDSNKSSVVLSGHTDETSANIIYSIYDENPNTGAISGNRDVSQGDFSITVDLSSLDGGTITATVSQKDLAQNQSVNVSPAPTATSSVTKPLVQSITSTTEGGYYKVGDSINITVNFSEAVNSTGAVRVNLNTGKYCDLSRLNNESTQSCVYTVQSGDNASPLNVTNISNAVITDQQGNVMVNFSPVTNLSGITVDTIAPNSPTVGLEDINDTNKTSVTFSGTGESGTMAHYSIDDSNGLTSAVTGSTSVNAGAYSTQIDLGSLDGGTITATVYLTDLAGNSSSSVQATAASSVTKPLIQSITSTNENGYYKAGDSINVTVNFSESVSSTENIKVDLNTGRYCEITPFSGSSSGTCDYVVQTGDSAVHLDVSAISTMGEIRDGENDLLVDFSVGTNLSASKNIVINASEFRLVSFSSDKQNGTYGPSTEIKIIATYNEDINISPSPSVAVTLDTGAQITLSTIDTQDNKKLTGVYTVGATDTSEENTLALSVSSIQSQNVCDLADNCQTGTIVPPNNNISDTSAIGIDTESPKFSNLLPENSSIIDNITTDSDISYSISENLRSGSIAINSNDDREHFTCVLGGNFLLAGDHEKFDVSNCVGNPSITLTQGSAYTFNFLGTDPYNNQSRIYSRSEVSYMWNSNNPMLSTPTATVINPTSVTIEWTTDKSANSFVDIGTDLNYDLKSIGNAEKFSTTHSVTIDKLTPATDYLFRIRSADESGNEGVNDNDKKGFAFKTLALSDISSVQVTNITDTSATVNWNSDKNTYSYLDYGFTNSYGIIIGNEESLTKNHSMTVAGLDPVTTYYYRVRVKDFEGNYSLGAAGSFTTLEPGKNGESDAPTISGVKSKSEKDSSETISWKTNKDCNGMVRYGTTKKYGQSAVEDATVASIDNFNTSHSVTLTKLLSNVTYYFSVVSYDASGNIAVSGQDSFKTPAMSSISSVKITNITLTSATIIWETGDPTVSEVDYGFSTAYGNKQVDQTSTNSHKIELTGLGTGKTYHFRIKGLNSDKNSVASDDYVFATNPLPALESKQIGEVTDSRATLSWKTNAETDSYVEYVNKNNPDDKGVQGSDDLSTDHSITVNNLTQGSEYEFKIKGTDINKNSFESDPFSIKTDIDLTPPQISQVNTDSSLINGKDDKVQSIIFWKTDEASTSKVVFDSKKFKEGEQSDTFQQSKEDLNFSTNHTVILTNLKPGTVYYFKAVSSDRNNNTAESEIFSLLTPQKEKSVIQMIIANFEQTFGWMKKMKIN